MSSGGMVQVLGSDGTWKDLHAIDGYRTQAALSNFRTAYGVDVRLVNRKGKVLLTMKSTLDQPLARPRHYPAARRVCEPSRDGERDHEGYPAQAD